MPRERGTVLCVIPRAPDAACGPFTGSGDQPVPIPILERTQLGGSTGCGIVPDDFNHSAGSSARILSGSKSDTLSENEDHLLRVCREEWVAQSGRVIPEQEERR
jgi:hypothetical protein